MAWLTGRTLLLMIGEPVHDCNAFGLLPGLEAKTMLPGQTPCGMEVSFNCTAFFCFAVLCWTTFYPVCTIAWLRCA